MNTDIPDQLAILNLSGAQEGELLAHLVREKFAFTVINSTGGMIQEPEVNLLIGFQRERFPSLLEVLRQDCRPYRRYISATGITQGEMAVLPLLEAELGGAQLFIMNVERFEQI